MMKKSAFIILLLVSIPLFSCSSFISGKYPDGVSKVHCLPVFSDKDGWYGGDGAYSIKLDKERTLWLFGDTFAACPGYRRDRIDMDVILGTTVAISTCSVNNEFNIKYYLKSGDGKFVSSFGETEWLWPQDPFIVNDVLYIPLIGVTPANKEGDVFNFKITGHKFARIRDFTAADPREWSYDYIDLKTVIPPEIAAFATTSVVYDGYVYFYPFYAIFNYVYSEGKLNIMGNILARIPANKIDNPADAIEYFNKDGKWENKLKPENIKVILDAAVSEMSVRYHAENKKWIAVYLSTQNKGDKFLVRLADKPEGPWSEPKPLGEPIPEVDAQSPLFDKGNFCYAGKEHIEFAHDRNLVVTYVCNSSEDMQSQTSFIRRNLFLYRPVVREAFY